jgi:hypothetical protein
MVTPLDARGLAATQMPVDRKGITKPPVSDIGDEAVYGTNAGFATTLSVKKRTFSSSFTFTGSR